MPSSSSKPNLAMTSSQKKVPRLDFSLLEPKYWYKYSADQPRTGKKCVFKDACPPKPIYAIGHTSSCRRAAPKFVPARRLQLLTETSDIARKVKDKIEFGEIKPLFLLGPTKGPREYRLNTFENLFGGSVESPVGTTSMPCIPKIGPGTPSKRSQENSQTKARLLFGSQSEEDQLPARTGLRIVPNKCRDESDYWVTTFKRLPSNESESHDNSSSDRTIRDENQDQTQCESTTIESRQSHRGIKEIPTEGTKSYSTLMSDPSNTIKLNLGMNPVTDASEPAWPKKGNITMLLEQLMEEDHKPIQPSDLPIYLQGLKRSENGWYRRIRSTQIGKLPMGK